LKLRRLLHKERFARCNEAILQDELDQLQEDTFVLSPSFCIFPLWAPRETNWR
jgi:hypothetical protein